MNQGIVENKVNFSARNRDTGHDADGVPDRDRHLYRAAAAHPSTI